MIYITVLEFKLQSTGKVLHSVAFILVAFFLGSCEGESPIKLRKSQKSPFVFVLNITLCSLDVNICIVRTAAPIRDRSDANLWKRAILLSVFGLGLPNFQPLQHCREQ